MLASSHSRAYGYASVCPFHSLDLLSKALFTYTFVIGYVDSWMAHYLEQLLHGPVMHHSSVFVAKRCKVRGRYLANPLLFDAIG